LTFWRKIQQDGCALIFRDWWADTVTKHALRLNREKYSERTHGLLTWRLFIHPSFIIHLYYAFPSLYCRLPRKCETIFCCTLIRRSFMTHGQIKPRNSARRHDKYSHNNVQLVKMKVKAENFTSGSNLSSIAFVDIRILRMQKLRCYLEYPISDSLFLLALATIFEDG